MDVGKPFMNSRWTTLISIIGWLNGLLNQEKRIACSTRSRIHYLVVIVTKGSLCKPGPEFVQTERTLQILSWRPIRGTGSVSCAYLKGYDGGKEKSNFVSVVEAAQQEPFRASTGQGRWSQETVWHDIRKVTYFLDMSLAWSEGL